MGTSLSRHQIAVLLAVRQREVDHWRETEQDQQALDWHDHFDLCPDCITTEQHLAHLLPLARLHRALVRLEGLGWTLPCGVYHDPQGRKHRAWITRWHPQILPIYETGDAEDFLEILFTKPTVCAGQLTPF